MAANLQELGREMLVWLVATVGALGTLGQLFIALAHSLFFDAAVWLIILAATFFSAISVERIKQFLET